MTAPAPAPARPEDFCPAVRRLAGWFARTRPVPADDMAQAGMLAVLSRWDSFDPARSPLPAWVAAVAERGMRDAMKCGASDAVIRLPAGAVKRGVLYPTFVGLAQRSRFGEAGGGVEVADRRGPESGAADGDDLLAAARSLAGRPLTRRESDALLLYFVWGMTHREAGARLGCTDSNVCQAILRVVRDCREKAGVTS